MFASIDLFAYHGPARLVQGLSPAISDWPAGVTVGLGGNPVTKAKND